MTDNLTTQQRQSIALMAFGNSEEEAASKLGIHPEAIREWMKNDLNFVRELEARRERESAAGVVPELARVSREGENTVPEDVIELQRGVVRETRSWGFTLLVIGVIHLFASGFLNAPWGILLIIVGVASFYFRSAAMLIVYAVTLVWAAIGNLLGGQSGWVIFAVLQGYLAFRVLQKGLSFRQVETGLRTDGRNINPDGLTPKRSEIVFPWAGCLLGSLSLIGFVGLVVGVFIYVMLTGSDAFSGVLGFVENLLIDFGVLGVAVGLASVLYSYQRKVVAILGMVAGILTLLAEIILILT